jgi:hypothetical protein
MPVLPPHVGGETDSNWYVPKDRDVSRFVGPDGLPTMRLIRYRDGDGQDILRFCEDGTGLLVGPTDVRLPAAGLLVSQLRGERYYEDSCTAGDFRPGVEVRIVPEPHNPHDDRAVAVFDRTGQHRAAYINKQKARAILKRLKAGEHLAAISIRGRGPGVSTDQVAVVVATPQVIAHVLSPRPAGAPAPASTSAR